MDQHVRRVSLDAIVDSRQLDPGIGGFLRTGPVALHATLEGSAEELDRELIHERNRYVALAISGLTCTPTELWTGCATGGTSTG